MEDVLARAGFPADVFQTLLIGSAEVERVLRDPRVVAATLTGSTPAGKSVAAIAGDELKHTVLELGGSDPFVVMPSADLEQAAKVAAVARCQNNGQSCIAAKRFIVHAGRRRGVRAAVRRRPAGAGRRRPDRRRDRRRPAGDRERPRRRRELVDEAVGKGARVVLGGAAPGGPGWFYPPTLLTDVTKDMGLYYEEVFGPVAVLHRAKDLDEALEIANDTEFGLGSNAWTTDPDEQERFADELDAGMVFINGMTASYPELPFGGVKDSGYGRELADLGIREFCNAKTVWVGGSDSGDTSTSRAE